MRCCCTLAASCSNNVCSLLVALILFPSSSCLFLVDVPAPTPVSLSLAPQLPCPSRPCLSLCHEDAEWTRLHEQLPSGSTSSDPRLIVHHHHRHHRRYRRCRCLLLIHLRLPTRSYVDALVTSTPQRPLLRLAHTQLTGSHLGTTREQSARPPNLFPLKRAPSSPYF